MTQLVLLLLDDAGCATAVNDAALLLLLDDAACATAVDVTLCVRVSFLGSLCFRTLQVLRV